MELALPRAVVLEHEHRRLNTFALGFLANIYCHNSWQLLRFGAIIVAWAEWRSDNFFLITHVEAAKCQQSLDLINCNSHGVQESLFDTFFFGTNPS